MALHEEANALLHGGLALGIDGVQGVIEVEYPCPDVAQIRTGFRIGSEGIHDVAEDGRWAAPAQAADEQG
jgi:hypothetical protein